MPRPKKQQWHLVRARCLRKSGQRVEGLSASAIKVIMQQDSQLSEEELVEVQENTDAEIAKELFDFENAGE
jgi:hypothetical protein